MTIFKKFGLYAFIVISILISFNILIKKQESSLVFLMGFVMGLLVVFSILAKFLQIKGAGMADEIAVRTKTWWGMIAIMMLALSIDRLISFVFLSLICFMALREYFSLSTWIVGSKSNFFRQDKLIMYLCYLAIAINAFYAYTQRYTTYIIIVPVYIFLLIPIIFVLQNRTKGAIESLGLFSVGIMFFAFNLGHALFMINMGAMVLFFCFGLTEARDLIAFWIGKGLGKFIQRSPDNFLANLFNIKIAEHINPRKTWATGLITALLVAFLAILLVPFMPFFPSGRMSYPFAWALGFAIGILGLMGDLVFSMIKRDIGIKDTGTILPGHGGIIDRVNSLVFTIPITFHMINWIYF